MRPVVDDGLGGGGFFVMPAAWTGDAAFHKSLKRDLLSGVAAVARELTTRSIDVLIGVGQGALVAYLFSLPRLVEFALAGRHAQPSEGPELSAAWHGVRAVVLYRPRIFRATPFERMVKALPCFLYTSPSPRDRG